jgi:hypothetical protein
MAVGDQTQQANAAIQAIEKIVGESAESLGLQEVVARVLQTPPFWHVSRLTP